MENLLATTTNLRPFTTSSLLQCIFLGFGDSQAAINAWSDGWMGEVSS
jgi:hypothetical protein